jgi:probable rRNA maturation factor
MIDISNESGEIVDEKSLVRLANFVLSQMRINQLSDLAITLVDEDVMAEYHLKFLDLPGPTDVMSFPMDELRPPKPGMMPPRGLLGDIVLCPTVAAKQAAEHQRSARIEMEYLLIHGMLHLLGYDHAEEDERKEMFALNDKLMNGWLKDPLRD